MTSTIVLEKQEENFTQFPQEIEDFFLKKEPQIKLYPDNISSEEETGATILNITSASQYYDYLVNEINFWKKNDPKNNLETIVCQSRFQSALRSFDLAKNYINSPNSLESYLNQSINNIFSGALSSKTKLVDELLKHKDKSSSYITGFKFGMLINNESNYSLNSDVLQGFYAAMAYRNVFNNYIQCAEETIDNFKTNAEEATKNYSILNASYAKAFIEQEQRLDSITTQSNDYMSNIKNEKDIFFDSAKQRLDELEYLYGEKLKLSEPANYWEKIDTEYRGKGTKWLVISIAIAILIVGGLIRFLLRAPVLFSDDYHWFDNLKNSAIITVIASITIYMLRLTAKMALTSYHLSRDAKERKNLSYFYLALIEKSAVSDKERALILNSLFSRSDTGLLKGEAAPSMPSNITDIVELFKNK